MEGLPDRFLESPVEFFEDREGGVWLASGQHGVVRLIRRVVGYVSEGESRDKVYWQPHVLASGSDELWLAANSAVASVNGGELSDPVPVATDEKEQHFLQEAVAVTEMDGEEPVLWIGVAPLRGEAFAEGEKVPILVKTQGTTTQSFSSAAHPRGVTEITSMVARNEEVWLALGHEALHFSQGHFAPWHEHHGLPPVPISAIYLGQKESLWFGGIESGLFREDKNGQVTRFSKRDGLASDTVLSIFQDEDRTVWVGSPSGLSQIRGSVIFNFTEGPFHQLDIRSIVRDGQNRLWLGTRKGIYVVSCQELDCYQRGEIVEPRVARVGQADGLENETVYARYFPTAAAGADGRLYFCMEGGLACIDPTSLVGEMEGPVPEPRRKLSKFHKAL